MQQCNVKKKIEERKKKREKENKQQIYQINNAYFILTFSQSPRLIIKTKI